MENTRRRGGVIPPARGEATSPLQIFFQDIKFEHSLFALPFAYLGLFLAEGGRPRFFIFFWVSVAMVSFRTYAMVLNRLIDCEIDANNPRTASRALPQGKLPRRFFLGVALLSVLIFVGSASAASPLCLLLSPIPIFLAWVYPYLKRFTWLSHAALGILLGLSPYGAWLASRSEFSWIPGLLLVGVASWVAGFDILYSLQDFEFDQAEGLKSVPVRFGKEKALGISRLLHGGALLAWAGAGALADLDWIYGIGLAMAALFLWREHRLIERFGGRKIQEAFFMMNAGASLVIFLAALIDLSW